MDMQHENGNGYVHAACTVHRYAAWTWLLILHMYIQHVYGHASWTWTRTIDLDMHLGHGYASWTWIFMDMDMLHGNFMHLGHGHAPWTSTMDMG
jgi:hypothetical protein